MKGTQVENSRGKGVAGWPSNPQVHGRVFKAC